ncbi:phosphotransferase [Candidatus Dojkabacteria bacterium]|nr:phosphotransferase [Candidatus Dojkabacteria bacterium]
MNKTNKSKKYSDRLGEISDSQLQKALDKFDLGKLRDTAETEAGLFGQNMFLTSSKGEYVLRGVPHYPWQFKTEKFFADLLHEQTKVPVPWPYLLDEDESIFGWSYVIMPRMSGHHLSDSIDDADFSKEDRLEIAKAQGRMLAEAQKLTWDFPGKYDIETSNVIPFKPDYVTWYEGEIMDRLEKSRGYNKMTPDSEVEWAQDILDKARPSMKMPFEVAFVMQDYKPGNMVVDKVDDSWEVTGLFDLMESSFGNGEADLSRMFSVYFDTENVDLAYAFVNAYLEAQGKQEEFEERWKVFMLHDRTIIWEWVQRTDRVWWNKEWTFKEWVSRYMDFDGSRN